MVETGVIFRVMDPHGVNGPVARDASSGALKDTKTIDLPLSLPPVKVIRNLRLEGVHPAAGSSPQK